MILILCFYYIYSLFIPLFWFSFQLIPFVYVLLLFIYLFILFLYSSMFDDLLFYLFIYLLFRNFCYKFVKCFEHFILFFNFDPLINFSILCLNNFYHLFSEYLCKFFPFSSFLKFLFLLYFFYIEIINCILQCFVFLNFSNFLLYFMFVNKLFRMKFLSLFYL